MFQLRTNAKQGETARIVESHFLAKNARNGAPGRSGLPVWASPGGLGAFVDTVPTSGKARTKVTILGTDLKGATALSFNGTAATFKVVSASEITTTVPTGATSGTITVTTLTGTTPDSGVAFQIP
jgi:hypothetical protein